MESKELAMQIAKLLDSKKATRVKVLKVRDLTVLADYFVIASGTSSTHVKSLAICCGKSSTPAANPATWLLISLWVPDQQSKRQFSLDV